MLIHDIGKVREFSYDSTIEYSDAGRLVGHIAIGISMVEEKARGIEGFPPALLDLLRHYILSHHGVPEFGAIRQPMTAEAIALHYIDNLDAKLSAFFKATGDHPVASDNWTSYQKMFETYLYRGTVFPPAQGGPAELPAPAGGDGAEQGAVLTCLQEASRGARRRISGRARLSYIMEDERRVRRNGHFQGV